MPAKKAKEAVKTFKKAVVTMMKTKAMAKKRVKGYKKMVA